MVWSKPKPSKDWPMRESLYETTGSFKKVGKLIIRKAAFEKAERGGDLFLARGFICLQEAGPGFVTQGTPVAADTPPTFTDVQTLVNGAPQIYVRVEYSVEDYWRWICDRAQDVQWTRVYPTAWWLI